MTIQSRSFILVSSLLVAATGHAQSGVTGADDWRNLPTIPVKSVLQTPEKPTSPQNATTAPTEAPQMIELVYAMNQNQPIWTGSAVNNARVQKFVTAFSHVIRHGLNTQDYNFEALLNRSDRGSSFEQDFSKEVIRVARDLSVGRIDPRTISEDVKFRRRSFTNVRGTLDLMLNPSDRTMDALAPQHQQYKDLMKMLATLQIVNARGGFRSLLPVSEELKLGVSHPIIYDMKQRLKTFGFSLMSNENFDSDFKAAIEQIQITNLAKNTGEINPTSKSLWAYFAVDSYSRQQQVELMMEKIRWLPENLGVRHIIVNLATQQVSVIDPDLDGTSPIRLQKSITGKIDRKTPSMIDRVSHVVLNPKWNVPPGIFARDKVPALRAAFAKGGIEGVNAYLAKNHFNLVNPRQRTLIIPAEDIDWANLSADNAPFMIQQDSGLEGSLGVVKVMLGNPYNIYIHDTNERSLFEKFKRLLSSGCIRIEKPYDFAAYLLEGSNWTFDRIVSEVEGAETGKEQWVRIADKKRMPVYILPFTASMQNGKMLFSPDSYGQDRALLNTLKRAGYYKQLTDVRTN